MNRYEAEKQALFAQGFRLPETSREGYFVMKRSNPYTAYQYSQPRRFIGPVRSQANLNRQIARQRLAARGFKPGYTRTGGFYGRYGQAARDKGLVPEKKFFDTSVGFTFDATGEIPATGQLALIPQGDTESTRDGRQCTIESITGRGYCLYQPGAAASATTIAYLYLVQDTQTNGAAAAVTDVFTSTNLAGALHNLANSKRFRILKKWRYTFTPPSGVTTAYNNVNKPFDFFKKVNISMEYSSTTGAIGEIKSNNIFLMAGTDSLSDDTVTFAGNFRLRFRG